MRSIRCAGCVVMFAAVSGLVASVSAQQSAGGSSSVSARSAGSLPSAVRSLAGEWEGQIQVSGPNGMTGSSLVNMSARLENSDTTLACSFAGQAFGRPMQGSSVWTAGGGQLQHAMYSSVNGKSLSASSTPNASGNQCSLNAASSGERVEQKITMLNNNQCKVEWFAKDAKGQQTRVMAMDLTRMPSGQRAQAAAGLNDQALMGKARDAARSATANAEPMK